MTLPIFPPGQDPGPNFNEVLHRLGFGPFAGSNHAGAPGAASVQGRLPGGGAGLLSVPGGGEGRGPAPFQVTHGTTICAVRYGDGVIMAGDRRATAGSAIAHRTMEKVHAADTHSGVAIAGAAGPAMEMVRLFQLQLEHYEKVEGKAPPREGKP